MCEKKFKCGTNQKKIMHNNTMLKLPKEIQNYLGKKLKFVYYFKEKNQFL